MSFLSEGPIIHPIIHRDPLYKNSKLILHRAPYTPAGVFVARDTGRLCLRSDQRNIIRIKQNKVSLYTETCEPMWETHTFFKHILILWTHTQNRMNDRCLQDNKLTICSHQNHPSQYKLACYLSWVSSIQDNTNLLTQWHHPWSTLKTCFLPLLENSTYFSINSPFSLGVWAQFHLVPHNLCLLLSFSSMLFLHIHPSSIKIRSCPIESCLFRSHVLQNITSRSYLHVHQLEIP